MNKIIITNYNINYINVPDIEGIDSIYLEIENIGRNGKLYARLDDYSCFYSKKMPEIENELKTFIENKTYFLVDLQCFCVNYDGNTESQNSINFDHTTKLIKFNGFELSKFEDSHDIYNVFENSDKKVHFLDEGWFYIKKIQFVNSEDVNSFEKVMNNYLNEDSRFENNPELYKLWKEDPDGFDDYLKGKKLSEEK